MDPIGRIDNLGRPGTTAPGAPAQKGSGFKEIVEGAIQQVDRQEADADQSILDLLKGESDIHETMIAMQKADISMRLLLAVRNKAVEAYREIMHMQF